LLNEKEDKSQRQLVAIICCCNWYSEF